MTSIISPVGTSILTNEAVGNLKGIVNKHSNALSDSDIEIDDRTAVMELIRACETKLEQIDVLSAKALSAELNGIISYYSNNLSSNELKDDVMYLIHSDTFIGRETGRLVDIFLSRYFTRVIPLSVKGLQTGVNSELRPAFAHLATEIDTIHQGLRYGEKLIFNLTGGFKAVQGFMQTLGTFYADETIYIFQAAKELMRIPRLPVKLVAEGYIRDHIDTWRCMCQNLEVDPSDLQGIPETLYYEFEGLHDLSEYGRIVWNQVRKEIYGEKVLPSYYEKLVFGKGFMPSVQGFSPDRTRLINEKIDMLTAYLITGQNLKSLSFKKLVGKQPAPVSHEAYAWSDQDAKRIYCHYEGERLILDWVGDHLK